MWSAVYPELVEGRLDAAFSNQACGLFRRLGRSALTVSCADSDIGSILS